MLNALLLTIGKRAFFWGKDNICHYIHFDQNPTFALNIAVYLQSSYRIRIIDFCIFPQKGDLSQQIAGS